jgi:antitoxin VapB
MGMNIKNPETQRLARKLSELTGESMTQAITTALEERLRRLETQKQEAVKAKVEEIMKIVRRSGGGGGISSQDVDKLLYDEHGLPK